MVYQVGGQNQCKGFLANNWLDLDNTGPDLQKQDIIAYFSNSHLLNIYNVLTQVYPLAKFQPHMQ